jgi:hypothetical protein
MPHTLPATEAHQLRLLARAEGSAEAAEAHVRRVWLALLRAIQRGGPWSHVYFTAAGILRQLPAVAHTVAADLVKAHRDAATWTAEKLASELPQAARLHLLRRRGLVEREDETTRLLVGMLLPPLDEQTVRNTIYRTGWAQTFQNLTALTAPDALAARIASLVTQGLSVAQVARQIRPVVQEVQASARRVARTAGLWIAHEAERDVYRGLEGDLIKGYTVRAVLDRATRPAHRERDGQEFFCRPAAGQRGMGECPHPPREADGSWAFNCRCWLEPILSVG